MARLPQPGSDNGSWGDILNDYLKQAHTDAGILKANVVGSTQLASDAVTSAAIADNSVAESQLTSALQTKINSAASGVADGSVTTAKLADGAVTSAKIANATIADAQISGAAAIAQSKVSGLTTDLAAKATDTAVMHLAGTETVTGNKNFSGSLTAGGTNIVVTTDTRLSDTRTPTDNTVSAAKLQNGAVTHDKIAAGAVTKTDVGLGNVDNTTDLAKPISNNTQTALNNKAALSHTHAIADVTGLQTALDSKAAASAVGAKVLLIDNTASLPAGTPAGVVVVVKS